jgi:rhodanese-related sulfurtransferase
MTVALAGAALFLLPRLLRGRLASAEEVQARIAAGGAVLDVRSPGEFRSGAFPGAINIPLPSLGVRLAEVVRGRPVVVYCASGMRSAGAVRFLRRAGYDAVNGGGLQHMLRDPRAR